MQDLIVIGGGEHARVVMEIAQARADQFRLLGFVDRNPCDPTCLHLGVDRLGDDSALENYPNAKLILGIGNTRVDFRRRTVVAKIDANPERWATLVHPLAYVAPSAKLKPGVVVMANASVQTLAYVGFHCIVNTGSILEHDASLCDFSHLAPGAVIGGDAIISSDCFVGMGAKVRDHLWIGKQSLIGMGAVVTHKFPENSVILGCPAVLVSPR